MAGTDGTDPGAQPGPSRGAERLVVGSFVVSILAALGLAAVYWTGGQPQLEGTLLALALGGIGVGMVAWAKRFLPEEEVTEERGRLGSTDEAVAGFTEVFQEGEEAIERRTLLFRLMGGAVGALGLAALFPIRSLGPRAGRGLLDTGFGDGRRLLTEDERPVRPDQVPVDGVVTVWPEGHVGDADSPTLLIRVPDPGLFRDRVRRRWTVDGVVAYSKLCTHTGCPVGLYQAQEHLLLCPCHQSTFAVLDGAKPIFGPATRPLPQLPLGVNVSGELIARGDYREPVGPGFFDRARRRLGER